MRIPNAVHQESIPATKYQEPLPAAEYQEPIPAAEYQEPIPAVEYQEPIVSKSTPNDDSSKPITESPDLDEPLQPTPVAKSPSHQSKPTSEEPKRPKEKKIPLALRRLF